MFSTRSFEQEAFERANGGIHNIRFLQERLTPDTARIAAGSEVVCCFANDQLSRATLEQLKVEGIKLIALRSAGYNHVDIQAARELDLPVVRVPEYSPFAVAEHAVGLLLSLNRKIHRAYNRVRELNFSLEGLIGFDLHGKTVGIIGAGRIGKAFAQIMRGFGCHVLISDPNQDHDLSQFAKYLPLEDLLAQSDIISLHCPLSDKTKHILDESAFSRMKKSVILINTGRGALIDTKALLKRLKRRELGGACLDVYEEEEQIFANDLSQRGIDDDLLARLLTFPNVLITAHQGFLTTDALQNIAETTISNITAFASKDLQNGV